ncbi:hypothetical protein [Aminobacter sp. HY435]|uniref:hypothetical protein n=1 Tax=Aminobacter sp. HY435 TaxID=2970917 RepID=UPI0022B98909|nr:hypothetical protein [Aminobacter sp. HY435]
MPIDTTPTTPSTLLDAVNTLLNAIRVASVTSLATVDLNEDAAAAKKAIDDVSREVQMEGWEFNTEREVTLDPEPTGEVSLPSNTLQVTSYRYSSKNRLVPREGRLYDPKKRTYNIGEAVKVNLVLALEFAELTPAGRFYVTAMAARRFCLPRLPVGSSFKYTEELVLGARSLLEQEDTALGDTDLKQTSPHFARMGRR